MLFGMSSELQEKWFAPFLSYFAQNPSLNPWAGYLASGGDFMSFPYGPAMLLWHLPVLLIKWTVGVFGVDLPMSILLRLSLFFADAGLLFLFIRFFNSIRYSLLFYWLSPLVLYAVYWHGQNDIIPVFLIASALYALKKNAIVPSAALTALAVSAKLSILLIYPILLLYIILNNRMRGSFPTFLGITLAIFLLVQGPYFPAEGFSRMVYQTPESRKLFLFSASFGNGREIYFIPILYLGALYALWRAGKFNFDLLMNASGVIFFLVVLLTPASPGWYLWALPFLVYHQVYSDFTGRLITLVFSGFLVAQWLVYQPGVIMLGSFQVSLKGIIPEFVYTSHAENLSATLIVGLGLVLAVRMVREGIFQNDYYRMSKTPLSLGLCADKDFLNEFIQKAVDSIFPGNATGILTESKYRTNSLYAESTGFQNLDFLTAVRDFDRMLSQNIAQGKSRWRGVLSKYLRMDLILVRGGKLSDSRFMRTKLDQNIALRIDSKGKSPKTLQKDFDEFVKSSKDMIFEFAAVNPKFPPTSASVRENSSLLKLRVFLRNCEYYNKLMQTLIGVCALKVDMAHFDDEMNLLLIIEGDVSGEDIQLAAGMLIQNLDDITGVDAVWRDNVQGLVQLFLITQLSNSRKKRNVIVNEKSA